MDKVLREVPEFAATVLVCESGRAVCPTLWVRVRCGLGARPGPGHLFCKAAWQVCFLFPFHSVLCSGWNKIQFQRPIRSRSTGQGWARALLRSVPRFPLSCTQVQGWCWESQGPTAMAGPLSTWELGLQTQRGSGYSSPRAPWTLTVTTTLLVTAELDQVEQDSKVRGHIPHGRPLVVFLFSHSRCEKGQFQFNVLKTLCPNV